MAGGTNADGHSPRGRRAAPSVATFRGNGSSSAASPARSGSAGSFSSRSPRRGRLHLPTADSPSPATTRSPRAVAHGAMPTLEEAAAVLETEARWVAQPEVFVEGSDDADDPAPPARPTQRAGPEGCGSTTSRRSATSHLPRLVGRPSAGARAGPARQVGNGLALASSDRSRHEVGR